MNIEPKHNPHSLGIDTGGTYTDAVIFREDLGVIAKAKSLTTRHDLSIGISGAVEQALQGSGIEASSIGLVSISTTLATNALVEGQGSPVGLVLIGFDPRDIEKAGLGAALAGDPVLFLRGGHNVHGDEFPLDMAPLAGFLDQHGKSVAGFAVAGMFAVRNPSHELAVKQLLHEKTGLPITCSHELSAKLGGPKRALTTLLNARLIAINARLIEATSRYLESVGIAAPLMVVRGDGSLISAELAESRPIETILSGPAASLVGAKYLTGEMNALVSDIGGTTTDIAILDNGHPRINPDGAEVGGYKTMVEAVAMYTYGLGGDSEVELDETNSHTKLKLGPRRQIPLSLLAMEHRQIVHNTLKMQLRSDRPGERAGRFVYRTGVNYAQSGELSKQEAAIFNALGETPVPLDKLITRSAEMPVLRKLVSRGLVLMSGFTPSDAMHVLAHSDMWDREVAELGASLFARQKDRFGDPLAKDAVEISRRVKTQLTYQSARILFASCLADDNLIPTSQREALIGHALHKTGKVARISMEVDRPLIGLGASAGLYYPAIGELMGLQSTQPLHCDVCNAIGAVAGHVRQSHSLLVTSKDGGGIFEVRVDNGVEKFRQESEALAFAEASLRRIVAEKADRAGASAPVFETQINITAPEIEGQRSFMQAEIVITASGRPRVAINQ